MFHPTPIQGRQLDLLNGSLGPLPAHPFVIDELSRFVVDVERFDGPDEEKNAVGMGVLYTHGTRRQPIRVIPEDARAPLLGFYREYSSTIERLVDFALARHGRAVILDIHSYPTVRQPHELHGDEPRPPLCVGYEDLHLSAALREAVRESFAFFEQGDNQTFHGAYVPLSRYGVGARVQSVMLEIRRDQYMDEATGVVHPERVERISEALADLVGRVEARISGYEPRTDRIRAERAGSA